MPTPNLPSTDPAFEALWRLPLETDPPCTPAADSSPVFGRVNFFGDLAISWQSASQQFWESGSPLGEFDQIARSLVATCSASLSAVQRATELQRENATLKARLQELGHPATSSASPEPPLGSLDAYLRAIGESAASARTISHAAFDKLQQLEAALKTSESSLASEVERRQAATSELKNREAELLAQSRELALLKQGRELLQMGLAEAQTVANAAVGRETTLRAQWEACQAQLQSLQAKLSRAQEVVSQGQSDLNAAHAEAIEDKDAMAEYLAGELGRLKAYRLAYVRSSFFLQKLGRWMVVLLSYGAAGGIRQAFEQGYLRAAPPATFLDTARLARELPQDAFPSFEADDGLFFQAAPPPAAAPTLVEVSPQDLPAAIPKASEALAPPPAESADPAPPLSAFDDPSPPSPNVV
ncbi:stress response protein NST1-like [Zingiber officinale]|uniref:stress response protein NST1-like n=1 Tax=Zingiber officinale TaxID=94328 RepID=UPI001C4D9B7D|nr:stress response protein NST1-like [Zingiber officinale]